MSDVDHQPVTPSELPSHEDAERAMMGVRESFAPIFKGVVVVVAMMVVVTVGVMIWVCVADMQLIDKALVTRLIQIMFAMVLGAICIFLGVVVSWLGITASFALGARGESPGNKASLSLTSTSPGIVLLIGGIALIGAALYRGIDYTETTHDPRTSVQPADSELHKEK